MARRPPEGGVEHVIKDGEWAASVAARYGYLNWMDHVWEIGENASLRRERPDPHLLAKGDVLFVPEWEDKKESGSTEQRHRLKLDAAPELFRIRALGPDGEPIASEAYELRITSQIGKEPFEQKGTATDGDGQLTERIPRGARRGLLRFTDVGIEIKLAFGHLDPLADDNERALIRGTQQRLTSLGFDPGPVDGLDGPQTQAGVRSFQAFCEENAGESDDTIIDSGPIDGIVGPKTIKALESYYGC